MRYPHWRCQLLKPRKMKFIDKNSSFISLSVNDQLQMNTNEIESQIKAQKTRNNGSDDLLGVLLMDPINSPLLFPANSAMRGDHIKVPFRKGWRIFTIKIHQFRHLKSDPSSDCMEYSEDNTYGACVRKELVNIYRNALNCTPPLLVEDPASVDDHLCNKKFNLSEEEGNKIRDLFDKQLNFKPLLCKKPCTETTYEVQAMQMINLQSSGIGLIFDTSVDVTQTEFTATFVTLLTGLGGSVSQFRHKFEISNIVLQVSSGRTLLWIVMVVVSAVQEKFWLHF